LYPIWRGRVSHFSVGTSREKAATLLPPFFVFLENKVDFVLVGSIIHGAMRERMIEHRVVFAAGHKGEA
jgi:hypothetical protein